FTFALPGSGLIGMEKLRLLKNPRCYDEVSRFHETTAFSRFAVAKTHVKMVKMRNTGSNAFHVIPPRPCYPDWRGQKEQGKTGITGPVSGLGVGSPRAWRDSEDRRRHRRNLPPLPNLPTLPPPENQV